ncbi:repressor LexA, partial [Lactobacillus parabuchneri]|nr:repressor LexA [Lentilactobacillus parabuchneri]
FKESDHYRLQPENDTMAPIILTRVSILGKVVSLYRSDIS